MRIFYIRDNGIGIAEKDLPHVFEWFKRVGSQNNVGEGMGLTNVQTLVRRLGGKIKCKSEFGRASNLSFSIPENLDNMR
jgi:signal transduction histidine kinase